LKLILASRSPQRKALLEALGLEFEVVVPEVEELSVGNPRELVVANAIAKGRAVAVGAEPGATVIAGDTEVVLDGRVLGQPADEEQAREYLRGLSGRGHEVLGGLAVLGPEVEGGSPRERSGVEGSSVRFRELDDPLLDAYVASGEWEGRAGGYAVQGLGSALVEAVRGDLSNVIGLPVPLLARLAPELFSPGARSA
jgi:septum formation protein